MSEKCEIGNTRTVTNITGDHLYGRENKDVVVFRTAACNDMDFIPEGLTNFFPDIVVLSLTTTRIKILNGNELQEYNKLQMLLLGNGKIERIPGNFLQHTPDLLYVSFSNNLVTEVGDNLLDNLPNLQYVHFENNICIDINSLYNEIDEIKEILRTNCTFNEEIPTTPAPTCQIGNINERICQCEWDIELLLQENVEIRGELETIKEENIGIRQRLQNIEDLFRLNNIDDGEGQLYHQAIPTN